MAEVNAREFEEAFRTHYAKLVRYASRRVGPGPAADAVAETFLVAWRRWNERPAAAVLPWLFSICRLTLYNVERAERRREKLFDKSVASLPRSPANDPADTVTAQSFALALMDALRPADREILELVDWNELSTSEAAEVLSISEVTARVRLHRAKAPARSLIPKERRTRPRANDVGRRGRGTEWG